MISFGYRKAVHKQDPNQKFYQPVMQVAAPKAGPPVLFVAENFMFDNPDDVQLFVEAIYSEIREGQALRPPDGGVWTESQEPGVN